MHRPTLALIRSCITILGVWLLAAPALAQSSAGMTSGGMNGHMFRPAVDTKGYLSVNGTNVLGDGDYSFGLVLDLGHKIMPFNGFVIDYANTVDQGVKRTDHLIDTFVTGTLQFNYGIGNRFVVGAQLPLMVVQGPNVVAPGYYNEGNRPQGLDSQGLGNLAIHGKARLVRYEEHGIGLAALLQVQFPTGKSSEFRGDPGLVAWPMLAAELVPVSQFRLGLNVGYLFNSGKGATLPFRKDVNPVLSFMNSGFFGTGRTGSCVTTGSNSSISCPGPVTGGNDVKYNDLATAGFALGWRFVDSAELIAETYANQIAMSIGDKGTLGAEAVGGLKIYVEANSYLLLAGGGSVHQAVNTADIRGILGFIFEPSIGDRDGDGYKDDVDECPDDPEDFDHFQDEEGCPDPDNDRDGILDVDDECPLVPEDHDGDADEDGCPEGSLGDRDGDGILDNVDKCPDDPEDRDAFEDEDGCPDPDNDQDGILDVEDLCPNDPEDKDGFEDENGCPDLDNDKDRILDVDDSCPNDPESYNGFEDEDGCPDRGNVLIEDNEIIILDKIYFATDSAEILPRSFPIVDAVAATLMGNPHIRKVEIQGHADERGADDYNIRLTTDRAASVRQALAQRGVDLHRLRSAGYGERCPVDPGHSAAAWEKNRRVEFKILETDDGPTGVEVACPAGKELIPKD